MVNSCDVNESICEDIAPVQSSHVPFSMSLDLVPSLPTYLSYYVTFPPLEESLPSHLPQDALVNTNEAKFYSNNGVSSFSSFDIGFDFNFSSSYFLLIFF